MLIWQNCQIGDMLGLNKSRERAAQIDSNNTPQCIDPDENVLLHYGLDTTRQVLKEYKWFIKKSVFGKHVNLDWPRK